MLRGLEVDLLCTEALHGLERGEGRGQMLDGVTAFGPRMDKLLANRYARGARDRSIMSGRVVLPHMASLGIIWITWDHMVPLTLFWDDLESLGTSGISLGALEIILYHFFDPLSTWMIHFQRWDQMNFWDHLAYLLAVPRIEEIRSIRLPLCSRMGN